MQSDRALFSLSSVIWMWARDCFYCNAFAFILAATWCDLVATAKWMQAQICCHCAPQCLRVSRKLLAVSPGATDHNDMCEIYFSLSSHSHRAWFYYRPRLKEAESETTQSKSSQTTCASSDRPTSKKTYIVLGLRTSNINIVELQITRWIFSCR